MKRNANKVPEFDEIIFENRNKTYGAFDLRKHYKSTTSISILGSVALFTFLTVTLALMPEKGTGSTGPVIITIVIPTSLIPENIPQPALKPPVEQTNSIKNLIPVVSTDTSEASSYIPITEEIVATAKNSNVTDSIIAPTLPDPVIPSDTKPFIVVEEKPEYPGGWPALLKFVGDNTRYPAEAQRNNIQGKVILKFVVNQDGSVDRIVVLRSIDSLLDNEAVRVVKNLPRFKPGKQGGVPVPVWFTLPVTFRLDDN